jgi:hypothetical protein
MARNTKPKIGQKVQVKWWDAILYVDEDGKKNGLTLRSTIGYYIFDGKCPKSKKPIIIIAGTKESDGEYVEQNVLPKGWVKEWHKL